MVMGKRREKVGKRSQTLPSSPSHSFSSSSSSDFEFTISFSPRAATSSSLCPADDLFYKGQLLPLHLSPRLSMVRTLLSSSSSSSTATASRDSTASSSNDSRSSFASDILLLAADNCGSSRPSSVSEDNGNQIFPTHHQQPQQQQIKKNKYFSLSRFSSMFNKENKHDQVVNMAAAPPSSVKKMSITAKRVISKYLKKVKPLYEKLSNKQVETVSALSSSTSVPTSFSIKPMRSVKESNNNGGFSHSFSGNLRYPRRRSCISSCPSSMRSSPSHSGVLSRNGVPLNTGRVGGAMQYPDQSSMEELQSAIQGAIAHCKNSLVRNKSTVISNEIVR
ncbi:putative membrane-associated kinase regulator 1 [Hibiscus syriacus]|uniref:Membrane-associated kinase regulator 1 n=1 Tax=Hibiscus syriacus TaxID=106335 RepID=A0A6A3BKR8_HIBSY|nr:probable membrane-associated kinase regulator 1 [Hibiscus syriacus]KAE8717610.1 putative membrane-associated kinase regulator 1 [Hibiscus syriacus]